MEKVFLKVNSGNSDVAYIRNIDPIADNAKLLLFSELAILKFGFAYYGFSFYEWCEFYFSAS